MKNLFFFSLFIAFLTSKLVYMNNKFNSGKKIEEGILTPLLNEINSLLIKFNIKDIPYYEIIDIKIKGFETTIFTLNILIVYTPLIFLSLIPVYFIFKIILFILRKLFKRKRNY